MDAKENHREPILWMEAESVVCVAVPNTRSLLFWEIFDKIEIPVV